MTIPNSPVVNRVWFDVFMELKIQYTRRTILKYTTYIMSLLRDCVFGYVIGKGISSSSSVIIVFL